MKRLLFTALSFFLVAGVFAQEKHDKMHHKMKDGVMMKDGKMMMMKEGKTMEMNEDMTLNNGAMVMKDGTVKMKDGTSRMLKDGECLDMYGKMSMMKMDKKKMKE